MSWRSCALSLALLYLSTNVHSATNDEKECTIHSPDGNYYDLSPLAASKDYELATDQNHTIVMNVCKGISHETWGLKVSNPELVGGFIRERPRYFQHWKNTTLTMHAGRPALVMENGSPCKAANGEDKGDNAVSILSFICDSSVYGTGTPLLTGQWPPHDDELACVFFIGMENSSKEVDLGDSSPSLQVTVLVLGYLICGTLYNRFVLQLRGFDQIPQFSIEGMKYHGREALDWFRDIMSQLYEGGQRNGWGGSVPRSWSGGSNATNGFGVGSRLPPGGGGFRRPMPRTGGSAANSFSHQAQVDVGREPSNAPDAPSDGASGFARPSRGATNPISHQSQVNAVPQQTAPPPPKKFESGSSTKEERAFMLGDDDAEEDDLVTPAPTPAPTTSSAVPPSDNAPEDAAQLRGRGLEDGGTIRL
ncbi:hypothetical protein BT96DRAFT_990100 [Gymnopus androsaceus JB14]|uniref:MRH domain-containing protein n=1 Tax=Gymnopus androsaceus JB14 TaxID=1447944 RepID=A0A6A4I132_9AGAR|nr:hypothetical protein BT96DRAFT_990100 [Gymnopus androsaceus JB14]